MSHRIRTSPLKSTRKRNLNIFQSSSTFNHPMKHSGSERDKMMETNPNSSTKKSQREKIQNEQHHPLNTRNIHSTRNTLNASQSNGLGLKTQRTGRLMVHDAEMFSELLHDIEPQHDDNDLFIPSEPHLGTKKMRQQDLIAQAKARNEQRTREQWEQVEKTTQRSVQKAKAKHENKFKKQYSELMHERETFLSQIDKKLHLSEEAYMYGLAKNHEKWTKNVFEPIQKTISEQLEKNGDQTWILRNQMYEKYLQADAKKIGGVFCDITDSEYDPMEAHQCTIQYKSNRTKDPNKQAQLKVNKEREWRERTLRSQNSDNKTRLQKRLQKGHQKGQVRTGTNASPLHSSVREMFSPTQYGIAEATPSGHYSHQNPTVYAKPNNYTKSIIPMDHFKSSDPEESHKYVKEEQEPGKRIFQEKIVTRPMESFVNGDTQAELSSGKRVAGYKVAQPTIVLG